MDLQPDGKTALVTGSSKGIGEAITLSLEGSVCDDGVRYFD